MDNIVDATVVVLRRIYTAEEDKLIVLVNLK